MGVAETITIYWYLDVRQPDVLDNLREAGLLCGVPRAEPDEELVISRPSRFEQYRQMMEHASWKRIGGRIRQVRWV